MNDKRDELVRAVSALVEMSEPGRRFEAIALGLAAIDAAAHIELRTARRIVDRIKGREDDERDKGAN